MNRLWHKTTVIMKMAQAGARPFVRTVMRRLQSSVLDRLKAEGKPWDCSAGPEKFDAGPDEIEVFSISTEGVFVCNTVHAFQVNKMDPPTALQVVSPASDAIAAGFFDGQVIFVCPSETRALPGKTSDTCFKCQRSRSTLSVDSFPEVFQCTVQSNPPVVFCVKASALDPTNPKAAPSAGPAAALPVKMWMVIENKNKPGFYKRDSRKLSADTRVTFDDMGCGLPLSLVAGRCYQPACIDTASFELMPELVTLAADFNASTAPLRLRRCEAAQRCLAAQALASHEKGDAATVKWSCIKAQQLGCEVNDFSKIFCSGSKDSVDLFNTDANGELLFNIMSFCKEFWFFPNFTTPGTCLEQDWSPRCSSFSLQKYWVKTGSLDVAIKEPSTKLKELSMQGSGTRNDLFHGEMELTVTEFEKACRAFTDLLQEVIRVCTLLCSSAAVNDETRSELQSVMRDVQHKLLEIEERRKSHAPVSIREQREAAELRKQFLMEKQRAEQLENDKKDLQLKLDGTHESFFALLTKIASFSNCGHHQSARLNRQWASGSRQSLLSAVHDAAVSKHASFVCVHGHHGCGKSSALSQIISQLESESIVVISHMFMFGDAASSVDVAMASLCVQIWQKVLDSVSRDTYCLQNGGQSLIQFCRTQMWQRRNSGSFGARAI